jgi:hypothetical protein
MESHLCGGGVLRKPLYLVGPPTQFEKHNCRLVARHISISRTRLRLHSCKPAAEVREAGNCSTHSSQRSPHGALRARRAPDEASSASDADLRMSLHILKWGAGAPSTNHALERASPAVFAGLLGPLLGCAAALADEGVAYKSGAGMDVLKLLAGVAYIILVVVFVVRLLKKRATNATSQVAHPCSQLVICSGGIIQSLLEHQIL